MTDLPSSYSAAVPSDRPLALGRTWWTLGWLFVLFILYATLAPSHYVPDLHANDKLEHAGAFFAMTCWFGGLVHPRRYVALAVWMLLLGAGIEVAQGLMGLGRDADVWDFVADSFGTAGALLLIYLGLGSWTGRVERFLGFA